MIARECILVQSIKETMNLAVVFLIRAFYKHLHVAQGLKKNYSLLLSETMAFI